MNLSKDLKTIGSKTTVDFIDHNILKVPAKVDTGADSSSVWAGAINEENGKLSFVLFDQTFPFYTGETIVVDKFTVRSVKNSFGVSEFRYKVSLKVKLSGKTFLAKFTLSDRKNNSYPILIGRQTLKNRFVVDVSLEEKNKSKANVLMVSTRKTPTTAKFAQNISSHGKVNVTYVAYEDLYYVSGEGRNEIRLLGTDADIASFDLVYFKTSAKFQDVAAACARYLSMRGVKFIDRALLNFPATSKIYQYVILSDSSIRVPKSVFLLNSVLGNNFKLIEQRLGLPFVLKDIHGNKGEHNYLIKDKKTFVKVAKKLKKANVQCVAQAYIENIGDYRVLVFGKRIPLIIMRKRKDDKTHLNNTSQGATAQLVKASTLPVAIRKDSIIAADLMDREIAGVDMVQDKKTGMWYCLEVNDGPQLASGSFVTEKHSAISDYLYQELRK